MKKIAIVITPMCPQKERRYGIRLEKRGQNWYKTWAFPFKKNTTEYDDLNGGSINLSNMEIDETYPGCPFCQSSSLIQCGNCSQLYCYAGESTSTCPWCGNVGDVTQADWDNVTGGGY